MNDKHKQGRNEWVWVARGALFFLPFLGGVHLFDWDEINFAEIAREMLATGDYLRPQIDFQAFYQKPPLFIWMQALFMQVFGVGETAARLPNAVCGMLTLYMLYRLGSRLYNPRFGALWAGSYLGSVLPFLYFKSGIIDPWFNLFIFLGLTQVIFFYWKKEGWAAPLHRSPGWYLVSAGILVGLGILTKGPVAYLLPVLALGVYWLYQNLRFYISVPQVLLFTAIAFLVPLVWFGTEAAFNGPAFLTEFTKYQFRLFSTADAGHKGFFGYHFFVLLIGCFPASVFALRTFLRKDTAASQTEEDDEEDEEADYHADFRRWMKILFWVVLILFTLVGTKIVHYSSLAYFPLTYLAAYALHQLLERKLVFNRLMKGLLWGIGGVYMVLLFTLPFLGRNAAWLKPLFNDPFAQANLDAQVHWSGLEALPALFLGVLLFLSIRAFQRDLGWLGFRILFGGGAIFIFATLIFFVKRVEGYSQRAAVEFFQGKADEDCYILTHGYKSYAHLFYARKRKPLHAQSHDQQWLLYGNADKPVYVVAKIHKVDELKEFPQLEEIYRKNGFVFYQRAK